MSFYTVHTKKARKSLENIRRKPKHRSSILTTYSFILKSNKNEQEISNSPLGNIKAISLPHRLLVIVVLLFLLGSSKPRTPCSSFCCSSFCRWIRILVWLLLLHRCHFLYPLFHVNRSGILLRLNTCCLLRAFINLCTIGLFLGLLGFLRWSLFLSLLLLCTLAFVLFIPIINLLYWFCLGCKNCTIKMLKFCLQYCTFTDSQEYKIG